MDGSIPAAPDGDNMRERKYKKLIDCQKCQHFIEMKDFQGEHVICGRVPGVRAVVLVAPANHLPGIKNGVLAICCNA